MRKIILLFVAFLSFRPETTVLAYEIRNHREFASQAALRSALNSPGMLQDIGLKGVALNDASQLFPNSNGASRTILDIIQDGAQFEDELPTSSIFPRLVHHFYNPVTGQGLTHLGANVGQASPSWALANPGSANDQTFSYHDARRYFYDALTHPSETERIAKFGRMFQTLGHVLHHLQDMAQPQHVRNDVHCDDWRCIPVLAYRPSRYERYTRDNFSLLDPRHYDPASAGYAVSGPGFRSAFNSPRSFWHTVSPSEASPTVGMGIAEFTNNNFVSHGTNFDRPGLFRSPVLDPNKKFDFDIQELCLNANRPCPGLTGKMTFYGNTVRDNFLGQGADRENPRANTYSTFTQDLIDRGGIPFFSLNSFNFDAAHEFLLPRAVAFSAGMINYFFRGKIDLVPDGSTGTYLIKNLGNEAMSGTFSLYYDYDDSNAGTVNNRTLLFSWDRTIAANGQENIGAIPTPTNPTPKNPGEYMLVFEGNMGAETAAQPGIGAVVGKLVSSPILIFAVDRQDIQDGARTHIRLFMSEELRQKLMTNPGSISVQLGEILLPPMGNVSGTEFQCEILAGCVLLGSPRIALEINLRAFLVLSLNNAVTVYVDGATQTPIFFGNTPEDLHLISRTTLCANSLESTDFVLFGYQPSLAFSPLPVKFFFEGKVLFEFVVSPNAENDLPVVLSNVKGARLTDVNCRVSIQ